MARIRAIATCCSDSPGWPSSSKSASLDCTASRLAPASHLGGDQAVEPDLVADHVAEPDLAEPERHGPVAGREVDRQQCGQRREVRKQAAERDVLAERHELALDVDRDGPRRGSHSCPTLRSRVPSTAPTSTGRLIASTAARIVRSCTGCWPGSRSVEFSGQITTSGAAPGARRDLGGQHLRGVRVVLCHRGGAEQIRQVPRVRHVALHGGDCACWLAGRALIHREQRGRPARARRRRRRPARGRARRRAAAGPGRGGPARSAAARRGEQQPRQAGARQGDDERQQRRRRRPRTRARSARQPGSSPACPRGTHRASGPAPPRPPPTRPLPLLAARPAAAAAGAAQREHGEDHAWMTASAPTRTRRCSPARTAAGRRTPGRIPGRRPASRAGSAATAPPRATPDQLRPAATAPGGRRPPEPPPAAATAAPAGSAVRRLGESRRPGTPGRRLWTCGRRRGPGLPPRDPRPPPRVLRPQRDLRPRNGPPRVHGGPGGAHLVAGSGEHHRPPVGRQAITISLRAYPGPARVHLAAGRVRKPLCKSILAFRLLMMIKHDSVTTACS